MYIEKENFQLTAITEQPKNFFQTVAPFTGVVLFGLCIFLYGSDGTSENFVPEVGAIQNADFDMSYCNRLITLEDSVPIEDIQTYNEDISILELNSLNLSQRPSQEENCATLAKMYDLDGEWFNPIDRDLLAKTEGLIFALNIQPEIFPVPSGNIQLEYDAKDGRYLEFELFPDKQVRMMMMQNGSKPIHDVFGLDVNKINQVVEMFYDGRF